MKDTDVIILLRDDSDASQAAAKLFFENGLVCEQIWSTGATLPTAFYLGVSYPEIDGVSSLVRALADKPPQDGVSVTRPQCA